MKKTMYLALAVLFLWGVWFSTPLTALAMEGEPTITAVSLEATKPLIENCDVTNPINGVSNYNFLSTNPVFTITYSDGNTEEVESNCIWNYVYSIYFEKGQIPTSEFQVGNDTTNVTITLKDGTKLQSVFNYTIEANPIESISVVANKDLIENFSGQYMDSENSKFYYNLLETDISITVNYKDKESATYTYMDILSKTGYSLIIPYDQNSNPFECGTHTITVSYMGIEAPLTFNIVTNPVESIEVVANKDLKEHQGGYYINPGKENEYYYYNYTNTDIQITVNYKDGKSVTYPHYATMDEDGLYEATGYYLQFVDEQADNPFHVGENVINVSYMGVESTVTFNVVECPYESISLVATEDLIYNFSGEDGMDGGFEYNISYTQPKVFVKFKNETEAREYRYSECYSEFGSVPRFKNYQSEDYQFVKGENTEKVIFLGLECDFTFNIVETPVESIEVSMPDLVQYRSGYYAYDNSRFIYDINDYKNTIVTVNYTNENKESETYTLEELDYEYIDDFSLNLGDQSEELGVGTHQGRVSFMGYTGTFDFEIVENPVKSVSVVATKNLIENKSGWLDEDEFGDDEIDDCYSVPFFYYNIIESEPKATITFADGTVETYLFYSKDVYPGYPWKLYSVDEQDSSNVLQLGKNKAYFEFNGVRTEFEFEIIKNPIKNFTLTATKPLYENQDGSIMNKGEENEYFYYDIYQTYPDVTINYIDGTSKTYSYDEFLKFTDYYIDYLYTWQSYEEQLKLGEHTIKCEIDGFEVDYKFTIAKPEVYITDLIVVPENVLIEGGAFSYEEVFEQPDGTIEYYYVYEGYGTEYTVTIKYSDDTVKTYNDVIDGQVIGDGSLRVDFNCSEYENRYVVGKNNKAFASYKGFETEFNIAVVENALKSVEISGYNDFVITTTSENGATTQYIAESMHSRGMAGSDGFAVGLLTDKGPLECAIRYEYDSEKNEYKDIYLTMYTADYKTITSNKLSSNKWLKLWRNSDNVELVNAVAVLANDYAKKIFLQELHQFGGEVLKGGDVDKALTIASYLDNIYNYTDAGEDEKGEYAILTLEEAKKLASRYFADGKLDIESSPMYNAQAKEIKVYFVSTFGADDNNTKLRYIDGKFVLTTNVEDRYIRKSYPMEITLTDDGYIESIYVSEHSYTSKVIKHPTALEAGIREYTCSCGDSYIAVIDKLVGKVEENKNNSFSATITQTETENIVSKIEITEEEQALISSGLDLKVVLKVEEIDNKIDTIEKQAIAEIIGEQKLGAFIDIQLVKQIGNYKKNVEETKGEIFVSFLLPDSLINTDKSMERFYKVARYHDGDENKVTILDATFDEATKQLTFGTDRFSTYAIIYNDVEVSNDGVSGGVSEGVPVIPDSDNVTNDNFKDEVPKAGVISTSAIWFGAMAVSGLGALALSKKKKED